MLRKLICLSMMIALLAASPISALAQPLSTLEVAQQPAAAQSNLAGMQAAIALAPFSAESAPTAACQVTTDADSGVGSLREKLADPTCNPINFAGDYTIRLASALVIDRTVTVDGSLRVVTISGDTDGDGTGEVRAFNISGSGVATLTQLHIIDSAAGVGSLGYEGGAIHVSTGSTLFVQGCTFTSNTASTSSETYSYGGAIYNDGTLTVLNSTFTDNSATSAGAAWGGAIFNGDGNYTVPGTATVIDSTFTNNLTDSGEMYANGGGAIANARSVLTVTGSSFFGNAAAETGGAIYSNVGTATLTNDTFDGNLSRWGGGVYGVWGVNLSVQDSTFLNNTATNNAGAIAVEQGTLTVTGSTFEDNSADVSAGAIYISFGTATIETSTFNNNSVTNGSGGAVYGASDGSISVYTSTFTANTAGGGWGNGGAIDTWDMLTVEDSTFESNTSDSQGGAIAFENDGETGFLTNNTFSGNSAGAWAGGIMSKGTLTVINNTIVGNSAPQYGGGLLLYSGTLHLQNTIIAGSSGAPDCGNPWGGSIFTNINNLVQDGTCNAGAVGFVTGDPKLEPLTDNGGSTATHMPMPHSPAVDAGDDATCAAFDQRGVARPIGTHCEIGAVEAPLRPVIRLSKSVTPDTNLPANSVITYTLVLRNTGILDDPNVLLTDTLPDFVEFKEWVIQPAGAVEVGNQITWAGPLVSGSIITYTFQATQTAGLGETVVNTAEFSGTVAADSASAAFGVACGPTYLVTNDQDSGPGSLRNGLQAVCTGGTVLFDNDYTIHLDSTLGGATGIDKTVTVDGSGHAITISGDSGPAPDGIPDVGALRIAASGVVTLTHLSIVDASNAAINYGSFGMGAVFNQGNLTVQNCTFSGNRNLIEYAYGAGITSFGPLTVENSTFFDNLVSGTAYGYGGGLYGYNTLVINSTFYNNTAAGALGAYGGGIANGSVMTVINSTLYSNTVSTPGTEIGGSGLVNFGTLNFYNNIIAGGTITDCFNKTDWGAVINDNINNLVEDGTCSTNGVNFLTGDPRLGTLADNGGDTFTMVSLPDSPAIDAGDEATCPALDQRGDARSDWQCDIGATELQLSDSTIVHQTITGVGPQTFGPTLVKMDFGDIGELITATVEYHPGPYTYTIGLPGGYGVGWGPYYTITGMGASGPITTGISLTLTLPVGVAGVPYICKYIGQDWDCAVDGSHASFAWRDGITSFSVWTVGDYSNADPVVDAGPDQSVAEGSLVTFAGSFYDPGPVASLRAGEAILWDFGDGETISGVLTPTHTYADNGVYTVTLTITDTLGGVGQDTLLVTVENAAPVLGALDDQTVLEDTALVISVAYTDPGTLDTHTAQIHWGDGSVTEGTVDVLNHLVGGSHVYAAPGIYNLTLTLTDDDGGIDTLAIQVTVTPSGYTTYLPTIRR